MPEYIKTEKQSPMIAVNSTSDIKITCVTNPCD